MSRQHGIPSNLPAIAMERSYGHDSFVLPAWFAISTVMWTNLWRGSFVSPGAGSFPLMISYYRRSGKERKCTEDKYAVLSLPCGNPCGGGLETGNIARKRMSSVLCRTNMLLEDGANSTAEGTKIHTTKCGGETRMMTETPLSATHVTSCATAFLYRYSPLLWRCKGPSKACVAFSGRRGRCTSPRKPR